MIVQQTTKELLAESLKELSKFNAVDKITIKELTKNCGRGDSFEDVISATPRTTTRLNF